MVANRLKTAASLVLRISVLIVSVFLLMMMFDRGGWWIAACLAWLPLNWAVAYYYGDVGGSTDGELTIADGDVSNFD